MWSTIVNRRADSIATVLAWSIIQFVDAVLEVPQDAEDYRATLVPRVPHIVSTATPATRQVNAWKAPTSPRNRSVIQPAVALIPPGIEPVGATDDPQQTRPSRSDGITAKPASARDIDRSKCPAVPRDRTVPCPNCGWALVTPLEPHKVCGPGPVLKSRFLLRLRASNLWTYILVSSSRICQTRRCD